MHSRSRFPGVMMTARSEGGEDEERAMRVPGIVVENDTPAIASMFKGNNRAQPSRIIIGACPQTQGDADAIADAMTYEMDDDFTSFEVLGEVFQDFLKTNDAEFTINTLSSFDSPIHHRSRYWHLSIPYRATVFTYVSARERWVNIKLCTNGFSFRRRGGPRVERHDHDQWLRLSKSSLVQFSDVTKHFPDAHVIGWYNEYKGRKTVELKFRYFDDDAQPNAQSRNNILISFEEGWPDRDFDGREHAHLVSSLMRTSK